MGRYRAVDIETTKKSIPFCISFTDAQLRSEFFRWKGTILPKRVKHLLQDSSIEKVFHNAPFDVSLLETVNSVKVRGKIHDTLILAKIAIPFRMRYGLKELMADPPFNEPCEEAEEVKNYAKAGLGYNEMPKDLMKAYNINDTVYTMKLFYYLLEMALNDRLYTELEQPLIRTVADMQGNGIYYDHDFASIKMDYFTEEIEKTKRMFQRKYKLDNPNSPQQVSHMLYKRLAFKPPYFKGKSHYTTDDLSLKLLDRKTGHPVAKSLLKYRGMASKQKFLNQLLLRSKDHKFIYPSFNQMGDIDKRRIKTGRFSSSNPNFQNILRGDEIRSLIKPRPGYFFLDLDYSQIEMRLYAYYSKDQPMMEVYLERGDIHSLHKETFVDPYREDDGENRQIAKSIGFEILYGIGAPGLWKYLARKGIFIGIDLIKKMLDGWHEMHPSLQEFKKMLYRQLVRGHIEDVYHRKYFLPLAKSYIAVNYFIQGMSANIIKDVMPNVNDYVKGKRGRLLLTVHDELLNELPMKYYRDKKVTGDIQAIMELPGHKLNIPIIADYHKMKHNWGEKK